MPNAGLSLARTAADPSVATRTALIVDGTSWSFGELSARAASLRMALSREGVAFGSIVAVAAPNRVETVVAVHALLDLEATLVPIHPRFTPAEAEVLIADAGPSLTLGLDDLRSLLATPFGGGDTLPVEPSSSPTRPAPPAAMVYTSGTTGRPKGAVLSRRAIIAGAVGSALNLGWADDDRWLCCMPLCHVGGLAILARCLLGHRPVILEPRFDPAAVLASIRRHRATLLSVVPTMLAALMEADRDNALSQLRGVLVGGAGAPFALIEECARRGIPALTTYGLTECCSQVTAQPRVVPYRAERGSGVPVFGAELSVAGSDGTSANLCEVGRVRVRGAMLMDGYFCGSGHPVDPAVDAEGWFDTGDLGEIDSRGVLHIHARRTDLIVTGGENVYPVEVEQSLETIPGVLRALVFGVPDPRWGQVVATAVVLAPGLDLRALGAHLPSLLAPHKRPRLACKVASLPHTSSGKLERSRGLERYEALLLPL